MLRKKRPLPVDDGRDGERGKEAKTGAHAHSHTFESENRDVGSQCVVLPLDFVLFQVAKKRRPKPSPKGSVVAHSFVRMRHWLTATWHD